MRRYEVNEFVRLFRNANSNYVALWDLISFIKEKNITDFKELHEALNQGDKNKANTALRGIVYCSSVTEALFLVEKACSDAGYKSFELDHVMRQNVPIGADFLCVSLYQLESGTVEVTAYVS